MRTIEFVPNPNGVTRIKLDGVQLIACIDPRDINEYKYGSRAQYTILMAWHIIETVLKKISQEVILDPAETSVVTTYLKKQLGI